MRCPKCGYTSFDDLERCKKCKKPMPPATATLTGTVLEATAPAYLLWGAAAMTGQLGVGAGGGASLFASGVPRAEMQMPIAEETALENAAEPEIPEVDAATSPVLAQEPAEEMNLELGKVDISDLTAPEEDAAPPEEDEDFSLETLQVDDLGLGGGNAAPTAAAPQAGQYQPAAKTGTALDNFDIELDELLDMESEKA